MNNTLNIGLIIIITFNLFIHYYLGGRIDTENYKIAKLSIPCLFFIFNLLICIYSFNTMKIPVNAKNILSMIPPFLCVFIIISIRYTDKIIFPISCTIGNFVNFFINIEQDFLDMIKVKDGDEKLDKITSNKSVFVNEFTSSNFKENLEYIGQLLQMDFTSNQDKVNIFRKSINRKWFFSEFLFTSVFYYINYLWSASTALDLIP